MSNFLIKSGDILTNRDALVGVRVVDMTPTYKYFGVGEIVQADASGVVVAYDHVAFEINREVALSGGADIEQSGVIQDDGTFRLDLYTPAHAEAEFDHAIYFPESGGLTPHDFRLRRSREVFKGSVRYSTLDVSGTTNLPINYLRIL